MVQTFRFWRHFAHFALACIEEAYWGIFFRTWDEKWESNMQRYIRKHWAGRDPNTFEENNLKDICLSETVLVITDFIFKLCRIQFTMLSTRIWRGSGSVWVLYQCDLMCWNAPFLLYPDSRCWTMVPNHVFLQFPLSSFRCIDRLMFLLG